MMRMVSRMLLVIGTLGAVAVAGACGQPGVTNTSGHGLRWQRVSASSGPHPSWSRGIPDSIWYNRCARRVEWFVKYTQSGSTLFYWSGSQWHPTRLSPAFEQGDTNGVAAWNSDTCTVVGIGQTGYLSAKSRPGQMLRPTWSWDGRSWKVVSATSPIVPFGPGLDGRMVYDPATRSFLLWGQNCCSSEKQWPVPEGSSAQIVRQINHMNKQGSMFPSEAHIPATVTTWTFNGKTWTEEHPTVSPGLFEASLATYDPASRSVMMLARWTRPPSGSSIMSKQVNETWLWNGVTWIMVHPQTVPRVDTATSAMTYDPLLKGVVLYDTQSHTTWLWTGNDWERLRTTNKVSPEIRDEPSMVFDTSTSQLILAGGLTMPGTKVTHWASGTWVLMGSPH